ncbi:MAG: hypothetical protein WBG36_13410 [Ornithinimicrobium sp.]
MLSRRLRELRNYLVVAEVRALTDLQLIEAVDPVVGVDLLVEWKPRRS